MSLAEMLVAIAVSSIAFLLASALLVEMTQQAESQIGRDPSSRRSADLVLRAIERDVAQAVSLPHQMRGRHASPHEMLLIRPDGTGVVFVLDDDRVLRIAQRSEQAQQVTSLGEDVVSLVIRMRSRHLIDVTVRTRGQPARTRTILLRNLGRELEAER